jgi:hypothetical protein
MAALLTLLALPSVLALGIAVAAGVLHASTVFLLVAAVVAAVLFLSETS